MSMKPTPTDDAFALLAIAVGFASNAAFTMALFYTPPALLDSRVLEPARWEESAVYRLDWREPDLGVQWPVLDQWPGLDVGERVRMVGPEDERTGWLPVAEPPEVIWEFRAR